MIKNAKINNQMRVAIFFIRQDQSDSPLPKRFEYAQPHPFQA